MVPAKPSLATTRSASAENKRDVMVCNTFGSTPAASTSQAAPSSKRLSTPCFAGTVMPLNATCTLQMSRDLPWMLTSGPANCPGNQLFGRADGSPGDGPFKSLLLRHQLNSSLKKANN